MKPATLQKHLFNRSPLLWITGLALLFRWAYPTGVIFETDFAHARLAAEFANALRPFFNPAAWQPALLQDSWNLLLAAIQINGAGQFFAYLPVSLSYAILGINDFSSLLYPLLCSMLGLFFFLGVARILTGQPTAWIAAFLWSVFPSEIYYSTVMSTVTPAFMLNMATLYFFLASGRSKGKTSLLFAGASFISLLLSIAINSSGWLMAPVIVMLAIIHRGLHPGIEKVICKFEKRYSLQASTTAKITAVGMIILWLAFAIIRCGGEKLIRNIADILYAPYRILAHENMWFLFLPLTAAAILTLAWKKNPRLRDVAVWLAVLYPFAAIDLFCEVGSEKFILNLYAPLILMGAAYLSSVFDCENQQPLKKLLVVDVLLMGIFLWLAKTSTPVILNLQPLSRRLIFLFSILAGSISFFLIMLSPLFSKISARNRKMVICVIFLCLFGLAMLEPVRQQHDSVNHSSRSSEAIYRFLSEQEQALPVYSKDPYMLQRLQYLSGYRWGMNGNNGLLKTPLQRLPEDGSIADDAYIITTGVASQDNWLPLKQFMQPGYPVYWVYRVSSPSKARTALTEYLDKKTDDTLDAQDYFTLYQTARMAGDSCLSLTSWMKAANMGAANTLFIALDENWRNCLNPSEDLISGQEWDKSGYSYGIFSQSIDTDDNRMVTGYNKTKYSDLKTFYKVPRLERGRFYIFEVQVRNNGQNPIYTPYLHFDDQEIILESGSFSEWHTSAILFLIPNGGAEQTEVMITPFLFKSAQTGFFKNDSLYSVNIP